MYHGFMSSKRSEGFFMGGGGEDVYHASRPSAVSTTIVSTVAMLATQSNQRYNSSLEEICVHSHFTSFARITIFVGAVSRVKLHIVTLLGQNGSGQGRGPAEFSGLVSPPSNLGGRPANPNSIPPNPPPPEPPPTLKLIAGVGFHAIGPLEIGWFSSQPRSLACYSYFRCS